MQHAVLNETNKKYVFCQIKIIVKINNRLYSLRNISCPFSFKQFLESRNLLKKNLLNVDHLSLDIDQKVAQRIKLRTSTINPFDRIA